MPQRPARLTIRDEAGRTRTLSGHPGQFVFTPPPAPGPGGATPGVILGLGPSPAAAIGILKHHRHGVAPIRYVEAPAFQAQMDASWSRGIPLGASALPWPREAPDAPIPDEILELLRSAALLIYKSGIKLFPSFWAPVLAAVRLARAGLPMDATASSDAPSAVWSKPPRSANTACRVLIPGTPHDLLRQELAHGFTAAGCDVAQHDIPAGSEPSTIAALLSAHRPNLFFSVNFRGLDPLGESFHLLRRAGTRTAVWFVDTPFHQLSGMDAPFWREIPLFVTDASFIKPLKAHGAREVHHLPLAASPGMCDAAGIKPSALPVPASALAKEAVFVGRSSFPEKQSFFAGMQVPPELTDKARAMLASGERPDFFWWAGQLGIDTFWPGKGVRAAGLGAEESSLALRIAAVSAAAEYGPTRVFGDEAWRTLLPESPRLSLAKPVDYYGPLAGIYAAARCVLGATSLLLPAGLTQRHFDVWAAGGLLLSDATPGLGIFPRELTAPITYAAPADIPAALARLDNDPAATRALREAWRTLILDAHTYAHRARSVLETMELL